MGFFLDSQSPFPLLVSNPRPSNHLRKLNQKWDETQTTGTRKVDLQRLTTTGICPFFNSFTLNALWFYFFPDIKLII